MVGAVIGHSVVGGCSHCGRGHCVLFVTFGPAFHTAKANEEGDNSYYNHSWNHHIEVQIHIVALLDVAGFWVVGILRGKAPWLIEISIKHRGISAIVMAAYQLQMGRSAGGFTIPGQTG